MPNFIFAYHGGTAPESQEDMDSTMAAWQAWFADMGAAVVNGGNPVGESMTVTKKGVTKDGGANPISGFSIVSADDYDGACKMASCCPMVTEGTGSVEVAQLHEM